MELATDIDQALQEFGFSDVEAVVYRVGLQLGSRPASIIAEKAGLKRTHTYNILSMLNKKGVVQEIEKNSVRHFSFSPPEALLSIMESREEQLAQQKDNLKKVVPHLKQLCDKNRIKPRMRFYRGIEGVKEVFADMVKHPDKEIMGILDLKHSATVENGHEEEWVKRHIEKREQKNIHWRGFAVESEISRQAHIRRPSKLRKTKHITGIDLWAELHVYDSKIAITSTYKEKVGVIIENQPIADTLRQIFELLWLTLPGEIIEG